MKSYSVAKVASSGRREATPAAFQATSRTDITIYVTGSSDVKDVRTTIKTDCMSLAASNWGSKFSTHGVRRSTNDESADLDVAGGSLGQA